MAVLALGAVSGCDSLLEVELPAAVTDQALLDPGTADVQVNSVIALIECAWSGLAIDAAGYEDNFQRVSGVAGGYSEYETSPGGGCGGADYASGWDGNLFEARGLGYAVYDRVTNWTQEQISGADGLGAYGSREALLGTVALYNAISLSIAGQHFCEFAISSETEDGPLLTYSETLDVAEEWATTALDHIATAGDFPISLSAGQITSSVESMAYGVRAQIRWANGELGPAADDASRVPDDFFAVALREDVVEGVRRNRVAAMQGLGGGIQAAGFLQGPVKLKADDNSYGITFLGTNPATGEAWPNPVPFTGYLDLGIVEATGRAIDDDGYPITTETAGTVGDTRVPHAIGNTAGGPDNIIQKYTSLSDDIPIVSWMEMRLIRAEAEGGAAAVGHVNATRGGMAWLGGTPTPIDLPDVSYVDTGDADQVEDMIIEERRRALWLEGRFWSTKILNTDKLWFPRYDGEWLNARASYVLQGGVRVLMPNNEYQVNTNFDLEDRATGCPADQAPIFLS